MNCHLTVILPKIGISMLHSSPIFQIISFPNKSELLFIFTSPPANLSIVNQSFRVSATNFSLSAPVTPENTSFSLCFSERSSLINTHREHQHKIQRQHWTQASTCPQYQPCACTADKNQHDSTISDDLLLVHLMRLNRSNLAVDLDTLVLEAEVVLPGLPSLLVLADGLDHARSNLGGDPLVIDLPL